MIEPRKNTREYGLLQERRIIDFLRRKPMTEFDLAHLMGLTRGAVTLYVTRMRGQKRIRIAGHVKMEGRRPIPLLGVGGAPDVEYVPQRMRKPPQPDRANAMRKSILALLAERYTAAELAVELHKSHSVIRRYIRELKGEGLVRISSWQQTGSRNGWAPVYKLGSRKDTPRPPALTSKQYHERSRADEEKREREKMLRRERDRRWRKRAAPAHPFSALGI